MKYLDPSDRRIRHRDTRLHARDRTGETDVVSAKAIRRQRRARCDVGVHGVTKQITERVRACTHGGVEEENKTAVVVVGVVVVW